MVIKYLDPYKDRTYGILKGDKENEFIKIVFNEGKFYKTDNGYVLMADVADYSGGIVRAYKPELDLEPGICAIPIHAKEYEVWEKKDKDAKATPVKKQPSLYEKNLCAILDLDTFDGNKTYQGAISFLPNGQVENLEDKELTDLIKRNYLLNEAEETGKLPKYEENNSGGSGYKKGSSKVTPKEKLTWLKTELVNSIRDHGHNEEMSLIDLVDQVVKETKDENVLAIYVDFVKNILN